MCKGICAFPDECIPSIAKCSPQPNELRYYAFPADSSQEPIWWPHNLKSYSFLMCNSMVLGDTLQALANTHGKIYGPFGMKVVSVPDFEEVNPAGFIAIYGQGDFLSLSLSLPLKSKMCTEFQGCLAAAH